MPAQIGTQLNNAVAATFLAAELNAVNRPFLAVVLDADPARSAQISGVEFGIIASGGDLNSIILIAQIARNFKPDPNVSIFDQIDDGVSALSPSRLVRPYMRVVQEQPFDRMDSWPDPIALDSNTDYTIVLGVGLRAALVNPVDMVLLVRGEWGAPGIRSPRLKRIV